jgi:phosphosulfolactate phosphohydrolase-like enzyme
MRAVCLTAVAVLAVGVAGCGGGAEPTIKDSIASMNAMADAMKAGDKAGVLKAAERMKANQEKMKSIKVSASEDKRLKEKYETELKAATENMTKAMLQGMTTGKFTPADMKEIGAAMKAMK